VTNIRFASSTTHAKCRLIRPGPTDHFRSGSLLWHCRLFVRTQEEHLAGNNTE